MHNVQELDIEEIKINGDISDAKSWWTRSGHLIDENGDIIWDPDDPMTNEEVLLMNNEQEIYNPDTKTIYFRKLRTTMVKNNPRVHMPKARPPAEEAKILTRRTLANQAASEYIHSQKQYSYLTASEK